DTPQSIRLWIQEVEEGMKSQLPDKDFELLDGLQAVHVLAQNLADVALQPVDVANTEQACREQKQTNDHGRNGDSEQQFPVHVGLVSSDGARNGPFQVR